MIEPQERPRNREGRPRLFPDRRQVNLQLNELLAAKLRNHAQSRGLSISAFARELVGDSIAALEARTE